MSAVDLVQFLLARIAEDEAAADRASIWRTKNGFAWIGPTPPEATVLAISGHRLLAECAAKRQVIRLMRDSYSENDVEYWALHDALRLLALPYADHPDYDESWRP